MLSKEQYEGIEDVATDELYAISGSGFGFPSGRYDNLTLGASGTNYTAPANGYVLLSRYSTAQSQYCQLLGSGVSPTMYSFGADGLCTVYLPIRKGQNFIANYTTPTKDLFRFIYAEGE